MTKEEQISSRFLTTDLRLLLRPPHRLTMDLVKKLIQTGVDQVLEFAEIPPPLVHAWGKQAWLEIVMAGASFVPHITLVRHVILFTKYFSPYSN